MYLYNSKTGYEKAILSSFRKTVSISKPDDLTNFIREKAIVDFKLGLNIGENRSPIFGSSVPTINALFNPSLIEYVSDSYFKLLLDSGDLDAFIKEAKINKRHSILKYKIEMFRKLEEAFEHPTSFLLSYIGEYVPEYFPYGSNGYINFSSAVMQKAMKAVDLEDYEKEVLKEELIKLFEDNSLFIFGAASQSRSSYIIPKTIKELISRPVLEKIL